MPPASCCGCCSSITKPQGLPQASGHISAQQHVVPCEYPLILASNQQRVLGPQAEVRVLSTHWPEAVSPPAFWRGPCGPGSSGLDLCISSSGEVVGHQGRRTPTASLGQSSHRVKDQAVRPPALGVLAPALRQRFRLRAAGPAPASPGGGCRQGGARLAPHPLGSCRGVSRLQRCGAGNGPPHASRQPHRWAFPVAALYPRSPLRQPWRSGSLQQQVNDPALPDPLRPGSGNNPSARSP
jgi:hypothetical protein